MTQQTDSEVKVCTKYGEYFKGFEIPQGAWEESKLQLAKFGYINYSIATFDLHGLSCDWVEKVPIEKLN